MGAAENETQQNKGANFLKRKNIEFTAQRYLIDALGSMAFGLFASLLIGTIFKTVGELTGITLLINISVMASLMAGPAIATAVAHALKAPPLVLFSSCIVGAVGYGVSVGGEAVGGFVGGGPVGALVATCVAVECGKLVSKETKVDILVTPSVTILVGTLVGIYIGPPVSAIMSGFGALVNLATQQQPIVMGIFVSALMGIALTLPISSAAIAVALGLSGLAAGAATVGCCTQMIGFAIMSFPENKWGGLVAQGLGTSMLQVPNIVRNWRVWIPPTLASMILGPFATTIFQMDNIPIGAGMGTCGLVGSIGTVTKMTENPGNNPMMMYAGILLLHFILPGIVTLLIAQPMRKSGWIKAGDLTLDL